MIYFLLVNMMNLYCYSKNNYSLSNSSRRTLLTSVMVSFPGRCLSSSSGVRSSTETRGITTNTFQFVDHPWFDLICKFVEVDINSSSSPSLSLNTSMSKACRFAGQFDVDTATADGKRYLVGLKVHVCMFSRSEFHAGDLGRRE